MLAGAILAGATSPQVESLSDRKLPRVHAMMTVGTYFAPDETGEIEWDRRLDWSGDVEIGERLNAPDFRSVEVPEGLSGKVRIRSTIDTDGTVKQLELLSGLGPGVDEALLEIAKAPAFAPSLHKAYGPVGIEVVFIVTIEPPSQPAFQRASHEGDVVELVHAVRPGEDRASDLGMSTSRIETGDGLGGLFSSKSRSHSDVSRCDSLLSESSGFAHIDSRSRSFFLIAYQSLQDEERVGAAPVTRNW